MNSYEIFGFILLSVNVQSSQFCYDGYCYSTDGILKNVSSLKDAQEYCYNNDNWSWLLELLSHDQLTSLIIWSRSDPSNFLLNMVGIGTNAWTSVLDSPLPSGFYINESRGQKFLYLRKSGMKLYFYGTNQNHYQAGSICRYQGNCNGGFCYFAQTSPRNWFEAGTYCYFIEINLVGSGHLLTFEGMTFDEVSNLSITNQLNENTDYWVGYSKLYYRLMHSNTRAYVLMFYPAYPQQTSASPNESYFVFINSNGFLEDKPVGNASFYIVCMKPDSPIIEHTSTSLTSEITELMTETHPLTSVPTALVTTLQSPKVTSTTMPDSPIIEHTSTSLTSKMTELMTETHPLTSVLTVSVTTLQSPKVTNTTTQSTFLLALLLPILLWLVFSITFACFIMPFYVRRNTRRESEESPYSP